MRIRLLIITIFLVLLIVPYKTVFCQNQIEYEIQVNVDGTALWFVNETGTNVQVSLDTFDEFQEKVSSVMDKAKNLTGREMVVDDFRVAAEFLGAYSIVKYQFVWKNFSQIMQSRIIIGDVFEVEDFFTQLYGEALWIYLKYPHQFAVESISPSPYMQNASLRTITWLGTVSFDKGEPKIVLKESSASSGFTEFLGQNAILIAVLILFAASFPTGFYIFIRQRKKERKILESHDLASLPIMESDHDKIVKLLIASGGSLHQSAISDYYKFSKAKTSLLLAALEDKGVVRRYKKGRDKIVVLAEKTEK